LYSRSAGNGQPLIVLHGGPDFDHKYLLPDLDRLADAYRLIYYDQRGRGLSAEGVRPEDVTMASEVADLDAVRSHFKLDRTALLGHSWGTVLALEYALRHPARVSHLILMNPAPASTADFTQLRKFYAEKLGDEVIKRQREIQATPAYRSGEPEAVAARYRLHFKPALARPEHYEQLMSAMNDAFISQGKAGIIKARAVEDRLMAETWLLASYDLLPKLGALKIPTLVVYGDHDFIPIETSLHIAKQIPGARLTTLRGCGHFTYLECPAEVRRAIDEFFVPRR
jgi:proline iminopeptidase